MLDDSTVLHFLYIIMLGMSACWRGGYGYIVHTWALLGSACFFVFMGVRYSLLYCLMKVDYDQLGMKGWIASVARFAYRIYSHNQKLSVIMSSQPYLVILPSAMF